MISYFPALHTTFVCILLFFILLYQKYKNNCLYFKYMHITEVSADESRVRRPMIFKQLLSNQLLTERLLFRYCQIHYIFCCKLFGLITFYFFGSLGFENLFFCFDWQKTLVSASASAFLFLSFPHYSWVCLSEEMDCRLLFGFFV